MTTSTHLFFLSMTQPRIIYGIYKQYLEEGGSNLIGTNTFSATTIAMADYEMEDYVYELNYEGARLARKACDEVTVADPTKPHFVVRAIGPTNRTGSISPSVEDPSARNVTFDELNEAYLEQVVGLMDERSDILMVVTILQNVLFMFTRMQVCQMLWEDMMRLRKIWLHRMMYSFKMGT